VISACQNTHAFWRGGWHQLPPTIPRSPGIISVVLSVAFFRPLRCDCSIKERVRQCEPCARFESFVLHNFFAARIGEYLGNKLAHRLFTAHREFAGECAGVEKNRLRQLSQAGFALPIIFLLLKIQARGGSAALRYGLFPGETLSPDFSFNAAEWAARTNPAIVG